MHSRKHIGWTGLWTVLLSTLAVGAAAASKPDLTGHWILNAAASAETVKRSSGRIGGLGTSVSVGGVGIPLPGSGQTSSSGAKLKDPDVLFAQEIEIELIDDVVVLHYLGLGDEKMRPGKHQGKKVRWSGKKLSESYETTSRKVSKKFELTAPDQMRVTVRLNPSVGDTRTYTKVFDRAGSGPVADAEAADG